MSVGDGATIPGDDYVEQLTWWSGLSGDQRLVIAHMVDEWRRTSPEEATR